MLKDSNVAAVRALYAQIDQAQSMAPLDEVADNGYTGYVAGLAPMDRHAMKAFGEAFFAACPGLTHTVEEILVDGDRIAVRLTVRGRQTRPLPTPSGSVPPSGKSFAAEAINFFRFASGRIVEQRISFDMLGFLQQIGAMPQ